MMNENRSQSVELLATRLVELETRFLHLERTLGDLDQVVLAHHKQIEALDRKIGSLQRAIEGHAATTVEERKPEDERPPHY